MAREIYPGYTLAKLNYSPEEQEWALYQKPLGDAAHVIETDFIDHFAFAYFGPSRSVTIGFAGDAPAGAIAALDATGLPYSTIEGVGFTVVDSQAAVRAVGKKVTDALVEAALMPAVLFSVGSDPTIQPGSIVVTITGDEAATRQAGLAAVGTPSVSGPFSVTVIEGGGSFSFVAN
ncbi:hypothetical protein E3O42_07725 [Cryobacterium adonitolivorans]|uniref:Uncharacterized protein n=1 Tax=Cryobacterium adonitolivorans TaxID=1259189 RepID=A0A4R8W8H2_9MICO|nr:hypothetical protein [Cryobacterium adonitolivorans]TFC02808.1 hypothetical protein E3O42_07725 [Cryobacterium adonitolivorans]